MHYALIIIFTSLTTQTDISRLTSTYNYGTRPNAATNVSRQEYNSLSDCNKARNLVLQRDATMPKKVLSSECLYSGY